jgi:DNA polymerase III gamma/tau subunit
MALRPTSAWFEKWRPQSIDEMIWPNQSDKQIVQGWFEKGKIDGNILLSGSAGTGKTTLAEILIKHFVKINNDLFRMRSRSVKEIDEKLKPFLQKKPIKSPIKMVYIEEFDRISDAAEAELKEGLMEKYIDHCVFIACTNHPKTIEPAVLTRFIYKFDFNAANDIDAITARILHILQSENAIPDEDRVRKFVSENYQLGMREMINLFQANFNGNNNSINYEQLEASAQFDENLVSIMLSIIEDVLRSRDAKARKLCGSRPLNTFIADKYTQFNTLVLNNSFDINYSYVLTRMYDSIDYLPIRHIIGRYSQNLDGKKFPQYHLESCMHEILVCCAETVL